jgi:hypothetical protein
MMSKEIKKRLIAGLGLTSFALIIIGGLGSLLTAYALAFLSSDMFHWAVGNIYLQSCGILILGVTGFNIAGFLTKKESV